MNIGDSIKAVSFLPLATIFTNRALIKQQATTFFRQVVKPKSVEKYENLLERLLLKGIELRFTTNLYPLKEAILASDFTGYGIHRFNNAKRL